MKTNYFIGLLVFLLFFTQRIYGQEATLNGVDFSFSTVNLNACTLSNFTVAVNVNSDVSGVGFILLSPDATADIDLSGAMIVPAASFSVSGSTLTFTDPLLAGSQYTVTVPVKANCSSITGNISADMHQVNFTAQAGGSSSSLITKSISISSGFLIYRDELSTNLTFLNGYLNTSFNRVLRFDNTSSHLFSGEIRFVDNKAMAATISSITLQAFNSDGTSSGTTTTSVPSSILDGSGNADARLTIDKLPSGGYVLLTENILISGCPELQNGQLKLSWGCANNTCNGFKGQPNELVVNTSINRGPERANVIWQFIDNPPNANCIDPANVRTYTVKLVNTGGASAFDINLGLRGLNYNPEKMTFIKEGEFTIIQNTTSFPSNSILNINASRYGDLNYEFETCLDDDDNYINSVNFIIPQLAPGEFIVVEWKEKDCCPLSVSSHRLNGWSFYNENQVLDECGRQIGHTGWDTPAGNAERYVTNILQSRIPTVTNMFGCQPGRERPCGLGTITSCTASTVNSETNPDCDFTDNFAVENDNFYIRLIGDGYPLNVNTFLVDVDIIAEGRLIVSDRGHFSSNINSVTGIDENRVPGNLRLMVNGTALYPVSYTLINNTDNVVNNLITGSGYTTTASGIRASFRIPKDIWDPALYDVYGREVRISQFINAAEVHFELSALCSLPDPPGSGSRYKEIMYLNADPSCTKQCRLPIGEKEGKVNVMCPGCEWPGVVTNTFDFKRSTFGFKDDDNNGLPDDASPLAGQTTSMKASYATYKDVIHTKTVSGFWGSAGIYADLQNDPDFGTNFLNNLCRKEDIPFGENLILMPASIKVTVLRNGIPVVPGIILPDAALTKSGTQFLYQITAALIQAQMPGFEYQIDDEITIESDLLIDQDFNFGDPNKFFETVDINTDVFLTGEVKDLTCTDPLLPCTIGKEVSDVSYSSALNPPGSGADIYNNSIYKGVKFVCEKWGASARFIRSYNNMPLAIYNDMTNFGGNTDPRDECGKHIQIRSDAVPGGILNAFPFEVRSNTGRTKKITLEVPNGYVIDDTRASFGVSNSFRLNGGIDFTYNIDYQTLQKYDGTPTFYNYRDIGPSSSGKGRVVEFYYNYSNTFRHNDLSDLNSPPPAEAFFSGDEATLAYLSVVLVPSCDRDNRPTETSVFTKYNNITGMPNVDPTSNFVDLPTAQVGDYPISFTKNVRDGYFDFYGVNTFVTVPNGDLIVSPSSGNLFADKQTNVFEFTLRNENANSAHNVFVAPELSTPAPASTPAFQITSVEVNGQWTYIPGPGWTFQPAVDNDHWIPLTGYDVSATGGIYKGDLANIVHIPGSGKEIKVRVKGFYNCTETRTPTTLKLNYGWNCEDGHPILMSEVADVCNAKFALYNIEPKEVVLTSSLISTVPSPSPCDHIPVQYTISSLGTGAVYNMNVSVTLPANIQFNDPNGLVFFTRTDVNGTVLAGYVNGIPPVITGNTYTWDVSAMGIIDPVAGLANGEKIVVNFNLDPGCQYTLQNIIANATATSFCDESLSHSSQYAPTSIATGCNRPVISVSGNNSVCYNSSAVLTANVTGGLSPFTYQWKYADNSNITGETTNIYISPALTSDVTYKVELTDFNGCKSIASHTITVNPLPIPTLAGLEDNYCYSTTNHVALIGTPSGGTFGGTGVTGNQFTPSVVGLNTITYSFTNGNGCIGIVTKEVTVYPLPIVTASNAGAICPPKDGTPICTDITASVSGGTPAYSFSWVVKGTTSLIGNSSTLNVCPLATTQYVVTVSDAHACSNTAQTEVTVGYQYALEVNPKPWVCGSTDKVCVTLKALRNVKDGVIGMDYALNYDKHLFSLSSTLAQVKASLGVVVKGNQTNPALINPDVFMYNDVTTDPNTGIVHLSIYYQSNTPVGTDFTGVGDVVTLCFNVLGSPAVGTQYIFTPWELQEAYTLYEEEPCYITDTFKVDYDTDYRGILRYMNTTQVLAYGGGFIFNNGQIIPRYNRTDIYMGNDNCDVIPASKVNPNTSGQFTSSLLYGNQIKIMRDINNNYKPSVGISPNTINFRFMRYVNGFDANYVGKITTIQPLSLNSGQLITNNTLMPIGLQMIAADVNTNDKVRSNDITLMQQRTVALISEYPQIDPVTNVQVPAGQSLDWRFIDKATYDAQPQYKISSNYTLNAGPGFYRDDVPFVPLCLPVTPQCKNTLAGIYHGVLLGDVINQTGTDPNTGQTSTRYPDKGDPRIRLAADSTLAYITLGLGNAQYIGDNTYRISVQHTVPSEDTLVSIDFGLNYDETKLSIVNVTQAPDFSTDEVNMMWNDYMKSELLLTSYTMGRMNSSRISYYLDIKKPSAGKIKPQELGATLGLLNGYEVPVRIDSVLSVTGNIDPNWTPTLPFLKVLPNPAKDNSVIEYAIMNGGEDNKITILNALGVVVREYTHLLETGTIKFNTEELASGVYFCVAYGSYGFKLTEQIVIVK